MNPIRDLLPSTLTLAAFDKRAVVAKPSDPDGLILEAWAQGYMVGSLIIMAFITMANMRKGVLLHKLILLELLLGIWQGFWLFFSTPVYAWWLSVGAIFLNASWSLHNVISWMKIKPFLSPTVSKIYIFTVILVQPYWIVEIYANFAYFHGINKIFIKTRPWEALCRDPWWIFTTVALVWTIKTQYGLTANEILRISPRFGIMLVSMFLSIIFIVLDVCSVTGAFSSSLPVGINPFWKLAFVFKCLTDMIVLDDFKTALDRLRAFKLNRMGISIHRSDDRGNNSRKTWERIAADPRPSQQSAGGYPSPDGSMINPAYFPSNPPRKQAKYESDDEEAQITRHQEHKDSVVAKDNVYKHPPGPLHTRPISSRAAPEDMVLSNLYDFPFNNTHNSHTRNSPSQDMNLHELPRYNSTSGPSPHPSPAEAPNRNISVHKTFSLSSSKRMD